jgi:hypothetical protein
VDLRGIVVDIQEEKGTVIVLTPEGDVREVITNGQQFQLGDTVLFYEKVIEPQKENQWSRRVLRYASATAAAVLLFFASPLQISDLHHLGNLVDPKNVSLGDLIKKNVAYADSDVYIESKSPVKVSVKGQKVVSASALNQPAEILLKDMSWDSNDSIDGFMQSYFEEAEESGYLNPGEPVVISVDTPAPGSEKDALLKKIETVSKKHHVKVVAVAVPDEVVKKAKELGVTPGKLVISLVAKATGQAIPIDKLKTVTVAELINTVPNVVEALPRFTESKLAELVRNISVVSAPTDSQSTETANAESPKSSEPEKPAASDTATQNVASDPQPSDADVTKSPDSTESVKYEPAESEQPQEQPETQPQEESASAVNEQQPEPQTQEEGQTQDNQEQEAQPQDEQAQQDDQAQESQPQENQVQTDPTQEEQAPGQVQEGQPQQNEQPQNDQAQQGEQTQPNDGQAEQPQDKGNSPVAAIFEWVRDVITLG